MIEPSPLAPVFLSITAIEIALGIYVLGKGSRSPINRLFFSFTLLAAAGNMLDLMMASLTSEEAALWTYRLLTFLLIVELGVAYRLSTLVPYDSGFMLLRSKGKAYAPLVFTAALLLSLTVWDLGRDAYGWAPAAAWSSV